MGFRIAGKLHVKLAAIKCQGICLSAFMVVFTQHAGLAFQPGGTSTDVTWLCLAMEDDINGRIQSERVSPADN
jgi:hypothetical protein